MPTTAPRTGYAPVNGLNLYYEISGEGAPFVMLHGGFGTADTLYPQLVAQLAEQRQVITVELQGHGHTPDIERPFSFAQFADDIAALLRHLGLARADVGGLSLGGGVAWQVAIRHPEVVRKLVVISAPARSDGWFPEVRAGMAAINVEVLTGSPMHDAYLRAAPRPDDFATLVAKTRALLTDSEYDWSAEVAALKAPALIVVGDADSVRFDHAIEMFGLLGGGKADGFARGRPPSQLAVLPDTNHIEMMDRDALLGAIIPPFLDAPLPAAE